MSAESRYRPAVLRCCRFSELARMVDPSNEPKTDKLSILGEAIRYVQQTQLENSQLRQLNKFLEVHRVQGWEGEMLVVGWGWAGSGKGGGCETQVGSYDAPSRSPQQLPMHTALCGLHAHPLRALLACLLPFAAFMIHRRRVVSWRRSGGR